MNADNTPHLKDLVLADPALGVLRLAALSAGPNGQLDDETLGLMSSVPAGAIAALPPIVAWPELVRGLMREKPSHMLRALLDCGALRVVLPEVAALFGVPQIADDPPYVDIGEHLLHMLDEAARRQAPLPVRFAALVMNIGKSDSPREHLPIHYRHIERGHPRIEALCARFGAPPECRELALLALAECERVHRVAEVRAGPVALLLERVGAFDHPERFGQLLTLCACDYAAYGPRPGVEYPKAALLGIALKACVDLDEAADADSLRTMRAKAIAEIFRSERWADPAD